MRITGNGLILTLTPLKEAATNAHAAGTAIKLKQELPIIDPVPMSSSVTKTPIKLANNSGTEAPSAISVDPAISGGKLYAGGIGWLRRWEGSNS